MALVDLNSKEDGSKSNSQRHLTRLQTNDTIGGMETATNLI